MLGNTDHTGPSGWHIHSQGMLELLRQRDIEWLAQRDGRNIFWIILNTVVSLDSVARSQMVGFLSYIITTISVVPSTFGRSRVPS